MPIRIRRIFFLEEAAVLKVIEYGFEATYPNNIATKICDVHNGVVPAFLADG
jgi:hypothetical protein